MTITDGDIDRILKLIDNLENNEVRLEIGDLKILVRKEAGSPSGPVTVAPATAHGQDVAPTAPTPPPEKEAPLPEGVVVRAAMLGTFYRSPSPGAPPYVEVGSEVEPDTTIALVEVMKLFNSIKAGIAGRVVAIIAEDGEMVEYNQALVVIEPHSGGGT